MIEDREAEVRQMVFAGKLAAETADEAQARLTAFLEAAPARRAILDLTLLAIVDPIGVKAIINAARAVPYSQLAYVAPAAFVRRSLEQSGAREVGPIYLSRPHAIAAMAGSAHLQLREKTLAKFRLGNTITANDLGAIYAAARHDNPAPLLVQVLSNEANAQQRLAFAKSAKAWCELTHPRIVPGVEVIDDDDLIAFVGERPSGQTWGAWLGTHGGRVSVEEGLRWMSEMAAAIEHAHQRGVVHGELRPECFVFNDDLPRVARAPLFPPGNALPSAYRSPEQLRGEPPTPRSDQFSLGVLLYEAIIGTHPFTAELEELIIAQQLQGAPLSPRVFLPGIPDEIERFLLCILARDPADRFASIGDLLAAIASLTERRYHQSLISPSASLRGDI